MKNGGNTSAVLVIGGLILFVFGVIGAPADRVWGQPFYVWLMRGGLLLIAIGLVLGISWIVSARVKKQGAARRSVAEADGDDESRRRRSMVSGMAPGAALTAAGAAAMSAEHLVNVDGTPMVDGGMVDVMGKVFGDAGTTFDDHAHGGISDSHSFSSVDSSSVGGSNW